jgi:hypothetical protein
MKSPVRTSRHAPQHRAVVQYRSRAFAVTMTAFAACAALAVAAGTNAAPAVTAASEQQVLSLAANSHTSATRTAAARATAQRAAMPASTAGTPSGWVSTPTAPVSSTPSSSASPSVVRSGILFGASLNLANTGSFDSALAAADRKYGHLGIVRVFYPGFPGSFASRPQLQTRPSVISFKVAPSTVLSGAYDARFKAWFASAPRTTDVFWTYWHEPENDSISPAQYRAAWAHLANLSHTANNPRLHATLVLMGFTLRTGSHRNWRDWYAGNQYIDVLAFDIYNTGIKNSGVYRPADNLYGLAAATAKSVGKPWGVAETASLLSPRDPTGTGLAAWIHQDMDYLIQNGASFASYFDTTMPGGDFRLTKAPAIAAWSAAVAKSKMG